MNALEEIGREAMSEAVVYAVGWRGMIVDYLEEACARCNTKGNRTLILNPMTLNKVEREAMTLPYLKYTLPVILSSDMMQYYQMIKEVMDEEKFVGLGRHKLAGVYGTMITYMNTRVAQVFSLRDEMVDTAPPITLKSGEVIRISNKYLLVPIYRMLEENTDDSAVLFEAERQWSGMIEGKAFNISSGRPLLPCEARARDILMASTSESLSITGVTNAWLSIEKGTPPTPIEMACSNINAAKATLMEKLGAGIETRQFGVNHPSGSWYFTVLQFLCDGRLVAMVYDTLNYSVCGIKTVDVSGKKVWITSPFFTMSQLLLASWLLERRGIDRSKGIYTLFRRYRDSLGDQKESYKMVGTTDDWIAHYFHKPG